MSAMASTPDGLNVSCRQCGGNVALRVAGPPMECGFCAEKQPLSDDVAKKVEKLRVDLTRHGAEAQQLAGKERMLGKSGGIALLVAKATLWLFVGLILWFTPDPLPAGLTIKRFLFEALQRDSGELAGPAIVRWWFLFTIVAGVSLNLLMWSVYRLRVASVVSTTLPRAPAASGRPPRCRCCGADLPTEGSVRRCGYCDAEHMVMGERYQRHQATLDQALGALRQQVSHTLSQRERSLQRLGNFTLLTPLSLFLLLAGALFAPGTYPLLWAAPAAALLLAMVLILIGSARTTPTVRGLDELRPGDTLLVSGKRYEVHARTSTLEVGAGARSIYLLRAPSDGAELAITIRMRDDDFEGRTYRIECQGTPWAATAEGGVSIQKLVTIDSSPLAGRSTLGVEASDLGQEPGELRFWPERPAEGQSPELTLVPEGEVKESELVMIAKDD